MTEPSAKPSPRVTVAGYLSLDTIAAPRGGARNVPGGAALYGALGARAASARVRMIAKVCDDFPKPVLDGLDRLGIDLSGLEPAPGATRRATLVEATPIRGSTMRRSPHYQDPAWWVRTAELAPSPDRAAADALVLGPMLIESLDAHLEAARMADTLITVDCSAAFAAGQAEAWLARLPRFDLFAPSREEVALLLPGLDDEIAQAELARRCARVAQKRAGDGLWWSSAEAPLLRWPSRARKMVDSTGAGDTMVGALAAGLARGLALPDLLELASEIAARCVAAIGPTGLGLDPMALETA